MNFTDLLQIVFLVSVILITIISGCQNGDSPELEEKAIQDVKNVDPAIYRQYVQCYPLDYSKKDYCLKKVQGLHLDKKYKDNQHYKRHFQYAAEKRGFLEILKNNGAMCDAVKIAPQFQRLIGNYDLECYNGEIYMLRYDDFKKQWMIVK